MTRMTPLLPSSQTLTAVIGENRLRKMERFNPVGESNDQRLREAANEFEAILMQQVMKSMRDAGFTAELIRKSEGEKVFQSLLDEQYARLSLDSGGLGLGEMIYRQLKPHLGQ